MSDINWLLLTVGLNFIVALLYLITGLWMLSSKKTKSGDNKTRIVILFVIFLLCPVAAEVVYFLSTLFLKIFFHKEVDLSDVIFSKDRIKSYEAVDEERERNMTSVEEAVAVSDFQSLRGLMLNVLRGDVKNSLGTISLGLQSEDSETSHYAAAALRDELGNFRDTAEKIYSSIKEDGANQPRYCAVALDLLYSVLSQKVLTSVEQKHYTVMMNEIGGLMYDKYKNEMHGRYYEWISVCLMDIQDYNNAAKWCNRSLEEYPDRLEPYKCLLKLYYSVKDRERFFNTLEALKNSQIVLDNETLEMIRVFS